MSTKKRFGDYRVEASREYPEPASAAPPESVPASQGPIGSVQQGGAMAPRVRVPGQDPPRRVRELSDKLPFSSRISPAHRLMLGELEQRTRIKQVALLEEALNLLASKYGY